MQFFPSDFPSPPPHIVDKVGSVALLPHFGEAKRKHRVEDGLSMWGSWDQNHVFLKTPVDPLMIWSASSSFLTA